MTDSLARCRHGSLDTVVLRLQDRRSTGIDMTRRTQLGGSSRVWRSISNDATNGAAVPQQRNLFSLRFQMAATAQCFARRALVIGGCAEAANPPAPLAVSFVCHCGA